MHQFTILITGDTTVGYEVVGSADGMPCVRLKGIGACSNRQLEEQVTAVLAELKHHERQVDFLLDRL